MAMPEASSTAISIGAAWVLREFTNNAAHWAGSCGNVDAFQA